MQEKKIAEKKKTRNKSVKTGERVSLQSLHF